MIASLSLSAFTGIEIDAVEYGIEDKVVFRWFSNDKYSKSAKSIIRYNMRGDAYFVTRGHRYYLKEFMKVGA